MARQWLRRFDNEKKRWTNDVWPATVHLAERPDMFPVEEDVAMECAEKAQVEQREMAKANQQRKEQIDVAQIKAKLAHPEVAPAAEQAPKTTAPKSPEELLAELDAVDPNPKMRLDDLDDMTKAALLEVIVKEELGVNQYQAKANLVCDIRVARAEKLKAQESAGG